LRISSPQGGLVFAGMTQMAADRQQQPHLRENENTEHRSDRFLDLELFPAAPMAPNLAGLPIEYGLERVAGRATGSASTPRSLPAPRTYSSLFVCIRDDSGFNCCVPLGIRR
jgi:hypothetical protein